MSNYSFKKYQPLSLRLWHWFNAFVILGLLGTVLLRKTFLSWRTNSVLIQDKLAAAGTTIPTDLAKDIAVALRNPMWDWHIYLGFALGFFFLSRIAIAIFVEKKGVATEAIQSLKNIKNIPAADKTNALHFSFVKIGYAVFYLATALMVVTGFSLNFKNELGLSKDLVGLVKEVHELMMWFFVVFVAAHLVGLVLAENRKDRGLISDMIHGGDKS